MMTSFSGNAIMTKAKAMYGKALTWEQYRELAQKKSVAEIAVYLRDETAYGHALQGVSLATPRGSLETVLRRDRFEKYLRLMKYAHGRESNYYHYLVERAEIEQILQMIRLIGIGKTDEFITQYSAFLDRQMGLNLMKIAKVRSFDELLCELEGTEYFKILSPFHPSAGVGIDFTRCETALYTSYYTRLQRTINSSFRGGTRRQLLEIFGMQAELTNLLNIYRMKRFYPNMQTVEITANLLPFWRPVSKEIMRNLLNAAGADAFMGVLSASRISGTELIGGGVAMGQIYKRHLRFASNAPVAFTAYMVLCEIEINNIISIIEAVEYGIAPAEILNIIMQSPAQKGGV